MRNGVFLAATALLAAAAASTTRCLVTRTTTTTSRKEINQKAWDFLSKNALASEPKYTVY